MSAMIKFIKVGSVVELFKLMIDIASYNYKL
jgi:hypothetical protein